MLSYCFNCWIQKKWLVFGVMFALSLHLVYCAVDLWLLFFVVHWPWTHSRIITTRYFSSWHLLHLHIESQWKQRRDNFSWISFAVAVQSQPSLEMQRHVRNRMPIAQKHVKKKVSNGIECFKRTIKEYVDVSSIQGLKYILEKGSNIFVK